MMMNERPGTLLPPGVVDDEEITVGGLTVNELKILENWEGYEGLVPPEIVALSVRQRGKGKGGDAEGLYPPGVE